VHTPTIAGNRPGDAKTAGLAEAIKSIVDYPASRNLEDVVLVGHSYAGMIITGVADQVPERIRRLVYWNAFVPNNGESINDMVPPPAWFDRASTEMVARPGRRATCQPASVPDRDGGLRWRTSSQP
jgi:pimeloyl-ACP methyl ester carboxylesterase